MKTKTGFTLVEVLIGLSIATTATVSVAYSIARTNRVADAGRKTFIATNLAHEGLELTRAKRDDAWFDNSPLWTDKLECGDSTDKVTLGIEFKRTVSVDCSKAETADDTDPEVITVTSTVTWKSPTKDHKEVSITEKLYNWYVAPTP